MKFVALSSADPLLKRERASLPGEASMSNGMKGEQLLGLCPGATTGSIEVREVVPT